MASRYPIETDTYVRGRGGWFGIISRTQVLRCTSRGRGGGESEAAASDGPSGTVSSPEAGSKRSAIELSAPT